MAELEIKPTHGMRLRVSGIILSSAAIVFVLVWLLTGGGTGLFARKIDVRTFIPDATGLSVGAPVRLNGIQVGTVKSIATSGYLDMQRSVFVDLRIDTTFLPKIPADSITSIGSDTLIGDKFLDIAAGRSKAIVADRSELRSEPAESAADKADLIYAMQDSMRKVDAMLAAIASPDTQLGRYIVGGKEYDQALKSIAIFESEMRALVSSSNPAGQAMFTTNMYAKMQVPLRQLDATLQSVQKGEGVAGKMYATDEQYNSIVTQLRDLRKSIAQFRVDMRDSRAGLQDEATYNRLRTMLASADTALDALDKGTTAELLNNPQLYESLAMSLKSIGDMVRDFGANPRKYLRAKVF